MIASRRAKGTKIPPITPTRRPVFKECCLSFCKEFLSNSNEVGVEVVRTRNRSSPPPGEVDVVTEVMVAEEEVTDRGNGVCPGIRYSCACTIIVQYLFMFYVNLTPKDGNTVGTMCSRHLLCVVDT